MPAPNGRENTSHSTGRRRQRAVAPAGSSSGRAPGRRRGGRENWGDSRQCASSDPLTPSQKLQSRCPERGGASRDGSGASEDQGAHPLRGPGPFLWEMAASGPPKEPLTTAAERKGRLQQLSLGVAKLAAEFTWEKANVPW